MDRSTRVAGEFATLAAARSADVEHDAIVIESRLRLYEWRQNTDLTQDREKGTAN